MTEPNYFAIMEDLAPGAPVSEGDPTNPLKCEWPELVGIDAEVSFSKFLCRRQSFCYC